MSLLEILLVIFVVVAIVVIALPKEELEKYDRKSKRNDSDHSISQSTNVGFNTHRRSISRSAGRDPLTGYPLPSNPMFKLLYEDKIKAAHRRRREEERRERKRRRESEEPFSTDWGDFDFGDRWSDVDFGDKWEKW